QIRSDVHGHPSELLRAGKRWSSGKTSERRNRDLRKRLVYRLCQPKIDDFHRLSAFLLEADHDVAWFDISVYEALFVHRGQAGRDLCHDFESQLRLQSTRAFNKALKGFPFDKLHRIEVILTGSSQVEHRGDIRVPDAGSRPGLAQETKLG